MPNNAGPDERPGHIVFRNNLRPRKHRSVAGSREFHVPSHESGTQKLRSDSEPQPEEDDPGMVHGEPEPRRPANSDSPDSSPGDGGLRDSLQSRCLGEALGPEWMLGVRTEDPEMGCRERQEQALHCRERRRPSFGLDVRSFRTRDVREKCGFVRRDSVRVELDVSF